ncbi:MAG: CBS domain-containing protein [Anaerolineales bacterium]|nr:CBS domain-containing protein [Anaerolineales bacterium]
MLVGERMSHPVISIQPDMTIVDALDMMRQEHIRRAPVMEAGKLVGIVSETDILYASPSPATSLSMWELNYLLSKITVKKVMTDSVLTVTDDTPIEDAARIMADNKIGGLPVMRDGDVVGIITETDLFKIFLELMGARELGVRVTALMHEESGQLAKLTKVFADHGGNIIALGTFAGEDPTNRLVMIKVEGIDQAQIESLIKPLVEDLIDIRICCE